jgi:hypothetical protein
MTNMFRAFKNKRYLRAWQDGQIVGYELALTRVEAVIHAETKKLLASKHEVNKELRVNELRWLLVKVKGLYRR